MLEISLVIKLLSEGRVEDWLVVKDKIDFERLGELKDCYYFIDDYVRKYGQLPGLDLISKKYGFEVVPVKETFEFLVEEVRKKILYNFLKEGLSRVNFFMRKKEPVAALEELERLVVLARSLSGQSGLRTLDEFFPEVVELYERLKNKKYGVAIPWSILEEKFLGWQPGEVYGFVARTKKGKSTILIYFAHYAWKNGAKVLFVSPEMKGVILARRFLSIHLQVPYEQLRTAKLGDVFEKEILGSIKELKLQPPFWVISDIGDISVSLVEKALVKVKPDILFLDGIYLLRAWGATLVEKVTNIADIIRGWARNYNIPIVFSTQFNRTVSQNATKAEIRAVALSDRLSWNADAFFALLQDVDLKRSKMLKVIPLLARDVELPEEFLVNFDFEAMSFDEVTPIDL